MGGKYYPKMRVLATLSGEINDGDRQGLEGW